MLTREQCEKIKEWGMPQDKWEYAWFLTPNPPKKLLRHECFPYGIKLDNIAPIPNLQQLLDFCIKVCHKEYGDSRCFSIEYEKGVYSIEYMPQWLQNKSLSLALYNLIEKIKEGK